MIPYKSPFATTVPNTLEKRLEIANAIRALASQRSEQLRQRQSDIAALRRDLEGLRRSFPRLIAQAIAEVRRDCDPRLRSYVRKYSPDQPRVPAGNPDGGQWTDGDEGEPSNNPSDVTDDAIDNGPSHSPDDMVDGRSTGGTQYAELDTGTRTDATAGPPPISEAHGNSAQRPVEVAGNDWRNLPVNLLEEEAPNGIGHAIRDHVGKSDMELLKVLENDKYWTVPASFIGIREGSFDSIESANDFVNRTLRANSALVELVVSGKVDDDFLSLRIGSVTGREAYRPDPDAMPYVRNTYAVGVEIWHDAHSPRGFRVRTAFPMNE